MTSKTLINVIDIEATCWDSEESRGSQVSEIIEIGLTVLDYKSLEIISSEGMLVKPVKSTISPFCTQLTSLTAELIEQEGISFEQAIEKLITSYKPKNRIFASYGDYDYIKFEQQFKDYGMENCFSIKKLNVKTLVSMGLGLPRDVGMSKALDLLKIPLDGIHHRGVDDSRNIAKILCELYRKIRMNNGH